MGEIKQNRETEQLTPANSVDTKLNSESKQIMWELFKEDFSNTEQTMDEPSKESNLDDEMEKLFADDYADLSNDEKHESDSEGEEGSNAGESSLENEEYNEGVDDAGVETKSEGLTDEEKKIIKEETGWSDEIINHIENMEQYEIYKNADLHEAEIGGRKCLVKDIDMDYVDPKTGMTNRELMEKGRSPIDSKTGEKIELHHMGQDYDSPFAELCENSEHGDGNHSVLHTKYEDSWRNNPELKNQYNNVDKPNHWKERAQEA